MAFSDELKKVEELTSDPIERPVEKHEGWSFGERVRAIEDDERDGVFAGDEGYLVLQEVGSTEYDSVRVDVAILLDGTDSPISTDVYNIESAN